MKKLFYILCIPLMMLCSSCGSIQSTSTSKLISQVQVGMTKDDVVSLFKEDPKYRRFEGNKEEWAYRRYSLLDNQYTMILIRFVDGKVTGMDSFKDTTEDTPPVNNNSNN